jgi:hypothetical protein
MFGLRLSSMFGYTERHNFETHTEVCEFIDANFADNSYNFYSKEEIHNFLKGIKISVFAIRNNTLSVWLWSDKRGECLQCFIVQHTT